MKRDKLGRFIKGESNSHTDEWNKKIGDALRGRKNKPHSEEQKRKISESMKGKHSDEKNPAWKGNKVKYMGLHNWIRRKLGTPKYCELCGRTDKKMYHWCSKSSKYTRDLSDWIRLCPSCHKYYDLKHHKTKFLESCKK